MSVSKIQICINQKMWLLAVSINFPKCLLLKILTGSCHICPFQLIKILYLCISILDLHKGIETLIPILRSFILLHQSFFYDSSEQSLDATGWSAPNIRQATEWNKKMSTQVTAIKMMMILIFQCHYSFQKGLLSVLYNKCNNDGERTIKITQKFINQQQSDIHDSSSQLKFMD